MHKFISKNMPRPLKNNSYIIAPSPRTFRHVLFTKNHFRMNILQSVMADPHSHPVHRVSVLSTQKCSHRRQDRSENQTAYSFLTMTLLITRAMWVPPGRKTQKPHVIEHGQSVHLITVSEARLVSHVALKDWWYAHFLSELLTSVRYTFSTSG